MTEWFLSYFCLFQHSFPSQISLGFSFRSLSQLKPQMFPALEIRSTSPHTFRYSSLLQFVLVQTFSPLLVLFLKFSSPFVYVLFLYLIPFFAFIELFWYCFSNYVNWMFNSFIFILSSLVMNMYELLITSNPHTRICSLILEREEGERKTLIWERTTSLTCAQQGSDLQTRHVPCLGIKPAAFWFTVWCFNQLGKPGQGWANNLKKYFSYWFLVREREAVICCSTHLCIHWLIFVCALTRDGTHDLAVRSGGCCDPTLTNWANPPG